MLYFVIVVYRNSTGAQIGCFVASTLIWVSDTLKAIETIKVGDFVYAFDTLKNKLLQRKVAKAYKREVDKLIIIGAGKQAIYTTLEHPFYIRNHWVKAQDLLIGDTLTTLNNKLSTISTISKVDTLVNVYNFTVEQDHDYFVGKDGVLVHNGNCDDEIAEALRAATESLAQKILLKNAIKYNLNAQSENSLQLLNNLDMKASDWLGKYRKAGIKSKLGEVGDKTIGEIFDEANSLTKKMIMDGRWAK
jgi:Pretoxin HINT domain